MISYLERLKTKIQGRPLGDEPAKPAKGAYAGFQRYPKGGLFPKPTSRRDIPSATPRQSWKPHDATQNASAMAVAAHSLAPHHGAVRTRTLG